MGYVHIVEVPAVHWCSKPHGAEHKYGKGTIWECDVCGKRYVLSYKYSGDQRESGYYWELM